MIPCQIKARVLTYDVFSLGVHPDQTAIFRIIANIESYN